MELAQRPDSLVKSGQPGPLPLPSTCPREIRRGFLRLHACRGLCAAQEDLDMRHCRCLVIREEHGGGVELPPFASVDFDGGDKAAANGGEEELLLAEADGVELLEFLNRGRDVRDKRE